MVIHIVCAGTAHNSYHSLVMATVDEEEATRRAEEFNTAYYDCDVRYHVHYGIPLKGAMRKFRDMQEALLRKELLT